MISNKFKKYSERDFQRATKLVGDFGAYTYAINNTQEYVTNVNAFSVLKDKFHIAMADGVGEWVKSQNNQDVLNRFLVGHSMGEVNAMNAINGSLKGLLYKAEFPVNSDGSIINNSYYDLAIKNRFTGEIKEVVSVKSNWSIQNLDSEVNRIEKWLNNLPEDQRSIAKVIGPEELIDRIGDRGLKIRTQAVGSLADNKEAQSRMLGLVENNDPAVLGELSTEGIGIEMLEAGGAGLLSVSVTGLLLGLKYVNGEISKEYFQSEMMTTGGISVTSASLIGGMSVLFPPGLLGIGIGLVIAYPLRRIISSTFGKGSYEQILLGTKAMSNVNRMTVNSIECVYTKSTEIRDIQSKAAKNLIEFANNARETEKILSDWYD